MTKLKNYRQFWFLISIVTLLQFQSQIVFKYIPHSKNSQGLFGQFGSNLLFILISVTLLLFIIWLASRRGEDESFYFYLFVAGSVSNIFDRLIYGGVIDYIKVWLIPLFNLADVLIVFGLVCFLLKQILKTPSKS